MKQAQIHPHECALICGDIDCARAQLRQGARLRFLATIEVLDGTVSVFLQSGWQIDEGTVVLPERARQRIKAGKPAARRPHVDALGRKDWGESRRLAVPALPCSIPCADCTGHFVVTTATVEAAVTRHRPV